VIKRRDAVRTAKRTGVTVVLLAMAMTPAMAGTADAGKRHIRAHNVGGWDRVEHARVGNGKGKHRRVHTRGLHRITTNHLSRHQRKCRKCRH